MSSSSHSKDLEELRQDAERLASQLPQSSTRDEALDIAIKAAETSMKALRLASDPDEKARCSNLAKHLMREAEAIKRSTDWRRVIETAPKALTPVAIDPSKVRLVKEPVNSRPLPTKEQIILLKSGFLNGSKFPEWKAPPTPTEFEQKDGEGLFKDESSELPLSDVQYDALDDWKRPIDALPPPSWYPGDRTNLGPVMIVYRDIDLVQDTSTDCSVVASLCAAVARSKRGHPKLLQQILFPYDDDNNQPKMSKNGKYILRMNFNGCYRRVIIDDRIPTSSNHQIIHVVDRKNPGLLWPALVEKAYLKVRGGYDFPGSNSATDLWILTGWIPEQVYLQNELELERFWKRILKSFEYGDVLITIGTGKISSKTEKAIGLVGEHDYAVLDLREVDGQRLLLIKNPWVEGKSWRGRFNGAARSGSSTQEQQDLIQLDDDEPVESPRDLLNVNDQLTPGTFWMDLDNVVQNFDSMYLNWNTGLFRNRQDLHFSWNLSESTDGGGYKKSRGPSASLQHHPQLTVTSARGGSIWVLLWRHFQNCVPENATPEEIESGQQYVDLNGHIGLCAFLADGRRVMLPERYVEKGWFVDSPQTLLKLEACEPGKIYTIVPLEQDLPSTNHTFTVSAFSDSPITLSEATPRFAYSAQVTGTWDKDTAGGSSQHPSYCDNPQFSLLVPQKTSLSLLLEACNPSTYVHVKLVHSNGKRVYTIQRRDIIADSKDHSLCCCLAVCEDLDPGKYTIICSTFEPQKLGDFALRIDSSEPCRAQLLPREGAGRLKIELGSVAFKEGETKVVAPFKPRRLINFYAIARHLDQQRPGSRSHHSHARLSVELGRGPQRRILIASNNGEYSESSAAIRTEPVDLGPELWKYGANDCWIVMDRMYVGSESQDERFTVDLYVDTPDAVDVGVWRARE